MVLTRHLTMKGPRWALDGAFLPNGITLAVLLALPAMAMHALLDALPPGMPAEEPLLAPVDSEHEIWASGVTYLRSRDARQSESSVGDVYTMVYDAERPELFLKATGLRALGAGAAVRIRPDSVWDVPEPEITLVVNAALEIVGYTAGNDMSSRSIEGENPLYLPQAKMYTGSCAIGPGICLVGADTIGALPVQVEIVRGGEVMFSGETSAANMKRSFAELVAFLGCALDFPHGVLLMTGTGIVPSDSFTLRPGDLVRVQVGELTLENTVELCEARVSL